MSMHVFLAELNSNQFIKTFQLTASYRHFHSYFIHNHKYKSTAAIRNFNYLTNRKFHINIFSCVNWTEVMITHNGNTQPVTKKVVSCSRSLASRTRKCSTKSALDVLPSFVTKKTNDKPLLLLLLLAATTPP